MEWGPRALGNRSILADPRQAEIREHLNAKIKLREPFRPFACSVLEEALSRYFDEAVPDPFMLHVFVVASAMRSRIPAVTHVDGTSRVQTVRDDTQPLYARLIRSFEHRTGIALVLNTSFNENEPIVDTPAQALDCFMRTDMDLLVLHRTLVQRRRRL
jgi:carbamoyltransferase